MLRIIYTLLLVLATPFLLYKLYKTQSNKPKYGKRWIEHFGFTSPLETKDKPIWIHAASVGESMVATSLIHAIKQQDPNAAILVTTTTSTGAQQIAKLAHLIEHRYMPIDFCWSVKLFLKTIKPCKLLLIETELWPNTLHTVANQNIPITVVNARLSERSYQRYHKVQALFNGIGNNLSQVLCQSDADQQRFIKLGVAKEKLFVTGSLKFDLQIDENIVGQAKELKEQLGRDKLIWIAASTHAGEEELLLAIQKKLLQINSNILLILVPRHPQRFDAVFSLCMEHTFTTIRRTSHLSHNSDISNIQVYLGDTMGEMLLLLATANTCFMGGSLSSNNVGGHNILEPASFGIPTIIGSSYFNFKEIVDAMAQQNLVTIVHDADQLYQALQDLITDHNKHELLKDEIANFICSNQGAIAKTMSYIN